MGMDIHAHIEVKDNGQWYHYGSPHIKRDYILFSLLKDTRHSLDWVNSIIPARGIPEDVSYITKKEWENSEFCYHSPSYIKADELEELERVINKCHSITNGFDECKIDIDFDIFKTLCNNNSLIAHDGYEDLRVVYWFDN